MAERLLLVAASSLDLGAVPVEVSLDRYPMRLTSNPEAENLAGEFLDAKGLADFVVVNFSAREPERDWPIASCARVISDLAKRHADLSFVLISPTARRDDAEAIAAACSPSRALVFPSSSDLLVIAALVRRARLTISPDTAAVHIAAATGCPVVGLYLQLKSRLWLPLAVPHRLVHADGGSPIAAIPDSAIIDAFEELWAEASTRPSNR
jgi:ADP-heptose:LPS heptosyltransferase